MFFNTWATGLTGELCACQISTRVVTHLKPEFQVFIWKGCVCRMSIDKVLDYFFLRASGKLKSWFAVYQREIESFTYSIFPRSCIAVFLPCFQCPALCFTFPVSHLPLLGMGTHVFSGCCRKEHIAPLLSWLTVYFTCCLHCSLLID